MINRDPSFLMHDFESTSLTTNTRCVQNDRASLEDEPPGPFFFRSMVVLRLKTRVVLPGVHAANSFANFPHKQACSQCTKGMREMLTWLLLDNSNLCDVSSPPTL